MDGLSAPTEGEVQQGTRHESNQALAITTLVIGIVSVVLVQPLGLVALILGAVIVGKTRGQDRTLTIIGMVLGGLALLFFLIMLVFMASMMGLH